MDVVSLLVVFAFCSDLCSILPALSAGRYCTGNAETFAWLFFADADIFGYVWLDWLEGQDLTVHFGVRGLHVIPSYFITVFHRVDSLGLSLIKLSVSVLAISTCNLLSLSSLLEASSACHVWSSVAAFKTEPRRHGKQIIIVIETFLCGGTANNANDN